MNNFTEEECINKLRKNGCGVERPTNVSCGMVTRHKSNIGLKMWSMIDYLCNYRGYMFINH